MPSKKRKITPSQRCAFWPCGSCRRDCSHGSIYCNSCAIWFHTACEGLDDFPSLDWSSIPTYTCLACFSKEAALPYSFNASLLRLSQTMMEMASLKDALLELKEVHSDIDTKEMIMKRLQHGDILLKELFGNPGEDPKPLTPQRQYLQECLDKQCALVSEISKNLKTIDDLKLKSANLKKENLELKTESRKLMNELKDRRASKKETFSKETKSLCEDLDEVNQRTAATKGILQGLIIGSGVDWAKDTKLEELVMKLGSTDIS